MRRIISARGRARIAGRTKSALGKTKRTRGISAVARKKIAAAQKARWANWRTGKAKALILAKNAEGSQTNCHRVGWASPLHHRLLLQKNGSCRRILLSSQSIARLSFREWRCWTLPQLKFIRGSLSFACIRVADPNCRNIALSLINPDGDRPILNERYRLVTTTIVASGTASDLR